MTSRPSTRDKLIDAAEALIAERGMAGASVREVQVRAGQANRTAVQYHFGSWEALVSAVIDARMGPVNQLRRTLLDDLAGRQTAPSQEDLVRAFVSPLARQTMGREGSHYARFLLQAMVDPDLGQWVNTHLESDSFATVYKLLLDRSPHPRPIARMRLRHVVNLTVITLANWEGAETDGQADTVIDDLVVTCVAILDAGAPSSPPQRLRRHS